MSDILAFLQRVQFARAEDYAELVEFVTWLKARHPEAFETLAKEFQASCYDVDDGTPHVIGTVADKDELYRKLKEAKP